MRVTERQLGAMDGESNGHHRLFGRRCVDVMTGMTYVVLTECGPGYLVTHKDCHSAVMAWWIPEAAVRFVREGA